LEADRYTLGGFGFEPWGAFDYEFFCAWEEVDVSPPATVSISIVSHGQMDLVCQLLDDIEKQCQGLALEVILTLNLQGESLPDLPSYFFSVVVIRNTIAKGFGANHNQAFSKARGAFFCVLNPDIRMETNPFGSLISALSDARVGIAAPVVLGANGDPEDSARKFPTPFAILQRIFTGYHRSAYYVTTGAFQADWAGGMFMLFPSPLFEKIGGFDERYFLYYEDVDLCGRLRLSGYSVVVVADSKVIHLAQRSSHKNIKFLFWHVTSLVRFFTSVTWMRLWMRGYL